MGATSRRQPTKKEKQDDSIMNTNSSCIVSKRCVEKIYFNKNNGFLRHFVPKFQRRSPLISRGYWLRMKAIQRTIQTFLETRAGQPVAIVNLGCGFDTMPFDFLVDCASLCADSTFVDVDYPTLMGKKAQVIQKTEALRSVLEKDHVPISVNAEGPVLVRSEQYLAVACDLEKTDALDAVLREHVPPETHAYLFIAEVSMTYMPKDAADCMIKWTSEFADSTFCLLEQFLPEGPNHPFAKTMLSHFDKLNSPLKSAREYESLYDQRSRFHKYQTWSDVRAASLWKFWCDVAAEGYSLDKIEPFDEWEEFISYASHYFLLIASNHSTNVMSQLGVDTTEPVVDEKASLNALRYSQDAPYKILSIPISRRFGSSALISPDLAVHHGGHGLQGRLSGADVLYRDPSDQHVNISTPDYSIACHTLTALNDGTALMVGGRSSPDRGSAACFVVGPGRTSQVASLPYPLYRHSAVLVRTVFEGGKPYVLVYGGKRDSRTISSSWLLWDWTDWRELPIESREPGDSNPGPQARFGASMCVDSEQGAHGDLLGGMTSDGLIAKDSWHWTLSFDEDREPKSIICTRSSIQAEPDVEAYELYRFGASLLASKDSYYLIGGVSSNGTISRKNEIVEMGPTFWSCRKRLILRLETLPMLVGMGVICQSDELLIFGGGAVCFSFGAHWNNAVYQIGLGSKVEQSGWRKCVEELPKASPTVRVQGGPAKAAPMRDGARNLLKKRKKPAIVIRRSVASPKDFEDILTASKPVILEGSQMGDCEERWSLDYLRRRAPAGLNVVVHDSPTAHMDFLSKNFTYQAVPFLKMLDLIESGAHVYMRSVSQEKASEKPTSLEEDWPWLAADFKLSPSLSFVAENAHSSVLRLSGPVTMWLHYDVMANVLCQVRGEKTLILYPPRAVSSLGFPHGASSSHLNPFVKGQEPWGHIERFEAKLKPGDVLFIPPLWAHAAAPTEGLSVAVNVFFRDLDHSRYAAGKDVYGNRDLAAYEHGRGAVQRLVGSFKGLPQGARAFYMQRLADELREAAR